MTSRFEALNHDPHALREENVVDISESAMHRALERRRTERPPSTPELVSARNNLAQTRNMIERRQKELELEIRMLQAEQHNLQIAWDATCEEWDQLWARGMS